MIEQPGKKKMLLFSGSSNEDLASKSHLILVQNSQQLNLKNLLVERFTSD